ncbi:MULTISPECIES: glutathione S-transferase N-terminal domain-containing protein [unclassified Halomonas]|uniref:glutathione S-transferase N-terminal domain-containing protein n=1 Tax=unclassified Halomonas TaxID=2609666 RepID=UPI001C9532EE|nr:MULTISPECIES: glutathione S-transferase N-terminal domain-containing protein [unclassified Halomonas]MBY5923901.1 glutathione S-transferase N-terminal domain-containing protein [Halomonas sp. DP4Y7-2]MBY5982903.1 glutathione S-transferase N-terminal domain-containing protein [Halomonas sp. DP5Y7-2]MBY6029093.1 glutathione S-transferase N-terminal domain-containing protein [Halomonas sp. DP8Y7-1]MBY6230943.1 glutathione S-transferase N-terminal domain-containing protein [Halomonas sp. DP4Y7-1
MALVMYDLCGIDEALRFSPFCWRAKLAVAHKGLELETRPWCFTEKEALEFSHHDKVPVMVDGDNVITDSFEIMQYLDRAYPEAPSLLGDSMGQARARFFKHYSERSLQLPILRTIVMDLINAIHPKDRDYFRSTREKRLGMTLEQFHSPAKGLSQLDSALEPLRGQLSGSDFVDGDAPAGADYLLFANFMWARTVSTADLVSNADPVYAWLERMLDVNDGMGRKAVRITDIEGAYRP